jgi:hypothetical protein
MKFVPNNLLVIALLTVAPMVLIGQTKGKTAKKTTAKPEPTASPKPTPAAEVPPASGSKRNERPTGNSVTPTAPKNTMASNYFPVYFYEYTRPGFVFSRIVIEHDEAGTGKILFERDGSSEAVTDPIQLSAVTLEKIKTAFAALNFIDSTETYQTVRDYSHMGNVVIRVKRDGREREVKYNWTDNKDAKFLMDEYRRVGVEYTWLFEMQSARDNQPLLTPGLVDALDSYLRRGEISHPPSMLPFLTKLSTDERVPLIARNHAAKLVAQIEKTVKK